MRDGVRFLWLSAWVASPVTGSVVTEPMVLVLMT
jgi:hypothetical protein